VSRLLNKARRLTAALRRASKKAPSESEKPFFYYRRIDGDNKAHFDRKRSKFLILFMKANKLFRIFEELLSIDVTPRIYRLLVWKYLPVVFIKTQQWLRDKFKAIASRIIFDYLESLLSKKPGEISLVSKELTSQGVLLHFPKALPGVILHNLIWTTVVVPLKGQTPL